MDVPDPARCIVKPVGERYGNRPFFSLSVLNAESSELNWQASKIKSEDLFSQKGPENGQNHGKEKYIISIQVNVYNMGKHFIIELTRS